MYHFIANVEYYLGQENVIIKKKKKLSKQAWRWKTLKKGGRL